MNRIANEIEDIFSAAGPLAEHIPGFNTRSEQIGMAQRVAATLARRGRLVVEAGTGTGKTFAYLVPALLSGRRVIVSTGTRTLQDQLFHRDLPMVARALGRPVHVALLKGRANYLCLHRLDLAEQEIHTRPVRDRMTMRLAAKLQEVRAWSSVTRKGEIGELAGTSEEDAVWGAVTSTRDNCLGPDCPRFEQCHVVEARREAQAADIVIVNHHLLMADLVLKEEGFGDLLPGVDAIIVDEAHQLPDIAAQFLGISISGRQLQMLARDLAMELVRTQIGTAALQDCVGALERHMAEAHAALLASLSPPGTLLRGGAGLSPDRPGGDRERVEYEQWSGSFIESLDAARNALGNIVGALGAALKESAQSGASLSAVVRRCRQAQAHLAKLLMPDGRDPAQRLIPHRDDWEDGSVRDRRGAAERLPANDDERREDAAMEGRAAAASGPAGVRWAQKVPNGFSVHWMPVDVAMQLGAIIESRELGWIYTSATLAVGDDLNYFQRRIGLEDAEAARYDSPFDFTKQTLLYLPQHLDPPGSRLHTRQVVEAALPVLEASGGRAFLLFTSHRALREAAVHLQSLWSPEPPFPMLIQGEAPRDVLLTRFREYGNAVLLGTGSFWEGVDVKGTALSVVVIDKLPFGMPEDPVLKARLAAIEARGGNPFFEEQVPQAVLGLKQGVGRLIRDTDDFGVVMLCDQRLLSRGYGRIFLDSLPPMPRTRKLAEVTAFLRERLGALADLPRSEQQRTAAAEPSV
jgi:ATP-dependent DNA helicase DinG